MYTAIEMLRSAYFRKTWRSPRSFTDFFCVTWNCICACRCSESLNMRSRCYGDRSKKYLIKKKQLKLSCGNLCGHHFFSIFLLSDSVKTNLKFPGIWSSGRDGSRKSCRKGDWPQIFCGWRHSHAYGGLGPWEAISRWVHLPGLDFDRGEFGRCLPTALLMHSKDVSRENCQHD